MDRLLTTSKERFHQPEPYARDQFIKACAEKLPAGSWVLDAGAGSSKYRPFFAHCRYETQDFCQYQGPLVRYLAPITYVCDITRIPLPNGSLDAIVCTEVLEHVTDPPAVLDEFARLLKPGGKLFLTAPFLSYLHMEPYHFSSGFTQYWYQHWLPLKGFAIVSATPVGGPGRSAVVFSQAFYDAWRAAERKLSPGMRPLSWLVRGGVKILVHYFLPWLLPRFDPWLGNERICSNYLVEATRLAPHEIVQGRIGAQPRPG
jgi:SAM-dependent methyltransferase